MGLQERQNKFFGKLFIIIFFICIGLLLLLFNNNEIELLFGASFFGIGILLLYFFVKSSFTIPRESHIISYDERSEINRLKASDISFRFLFIAISLLLVLYALNWVPDHVIIILLGPIVGLSIIIYFLYFYWSEKQVE